MRRMGRRRGFRGPARAASAAPLGLGRARPDAPAIQRICVYRLIQLWGRPGREESSLSSLEGDQCQRRYESSIGARCCCQCGMGMGAVGLATLLSGVEAASGSELATGNPLAPRSPHFPARAKHVIHLFMNGGPSQVDTFDPKPLLAKYDGKDAAARQPAHRAQDRHRVPLAVPVPEVWAERDRGQRALPAHGASTSTTSRHPLDVHRHAQPRASLRAHEHAARCGSRAEHGLVGHLRPRHREPEPARLRRPAPGGLPVGRRGQLAAGLPARRLPGHLASTPRHAERASR